MHPLFVIAAKDLRERVRDRSALVIGFVAPLLIALLMSLAFQGTQTFHADVAVVDEDGGHLAAAFVAMLRSPDLAGVITVRTVPDEQHARDEVRDGTLGAAFVVPAGFTESAHAGTATAITVLGSVDAAIARQVAASLADGFVAQVNADRLAVLTAMAGGASPEQLAALVSASNSLRLPEEVTTAATGTRSMETISYYAPSMGIFFMFFAIGFGARSFFGEKREGTLDRIAAAPLPPWALLAGKSLSTFAYGVASLTTMAVLTTTAFGAYWGPPGAVAAVIVAVVLATVALTALVIALARTERQAEGLSSMLTFALVLLGGNFVFVSAEPGILRRLALATPNGWAMRAFVDLNSGAGAGAALVPVLAIVAFAAVVAAAAGLLSHRVVAR